MPQRVRDRVGEPRLPQRQSPGPHAIGAQRRAVRSALRTVERPNEPVLAERKRQGGGQERVQRQPAREAGSGQRQRVAVEEHHAPGEPGLAGHRREPDDRGAARVPDQHGGVRPGQAHFGQEGEQLGGQVRTVVGRAWRAVAGAGEVDRENPVSGRRQDRAEDGERVRGLARARRQDDGLTCRAPPQVTGAEAAALGQQQARRAWRQFGHGPITAENGLVRHILNDLISSPVKPPKFSRPVMMV